MIHPALTRRIAAALLLVLVIACPARAQLVVVDPGNLVQAVLIAERTLRHFEALRAQYQTILQMSKGLGNMEGYRIPTIAGARHDASRWTYGGAWLTGLNAGDPGGDAYRRVTRALERPGTALDTLPVEARRAIEQAYATIEVSDSVAFMGAHQVGALRGYGDRLQGAVEGLQDDVLSGLLRYHELTAILDKVAAGELLGRRQDTAANQLLSHTLEQLLVRGKRLRDTEAATMNMRLDGLRDGRAVSASLVAGAAEDLRTWRQP